VDFSYSATEEGKVPICKILDFEKLLDAKREAFVAVKESDLEEVHKPKEVRFSINISDHDAAIKCSKVESFLNQGYGVTAILQFGRPIPYDKQVGEEFMTQLLASVDDKSGKCSPFTHNAKKGEVRAEIVPKQGPSRGRSMLKKELLKK
jgi:translation initiation factor IF-3